MFQNHFILYLLVKGARTTSRRWFLFAHNTVYCHFYYFTLLVYNQQLHYYLMNISIFNLSKYYEFSFTVVYFSKAVTG